MVGFLFPVDSARFRRTLSVFAVGLSFACCGLTGCQREAPPVADREQHDLDVGMPAGESDPGHLTDAPIAPPETEVSPPADGDLPEEAPEEESSLQMPAPEEQVVVAEKVDEKTPSDEPAEPAAPSELSSLDAATEQQSWTDWEDPSVVLVISGQQHGYIEPCGCTGLENQKGGMARRMSLLTRLKERGWNVIPIDGGNQVRRIGRQAEIKFQTTAAGMKEMGYRAVGFGPDDLRLAIGELLSVAAGDPEDPSMFASASVTLLDPELMQQVKTITAGGKTLAVTSILDPETLDYETGDEIIVDPVATAMASAAEKIGAAEADYRVLTFFGTEEAAQEAVQAADANPFDLVVVVGGYGEPTYRPQAIPGTDTQMIFTGDKGMYVGVVGLFPDGSMRYSRVALSDDFADAEPMMDLLASYQEQLKALGLEGLGLQPIPHPAGDRFVGSQVCGDCHTTAFAIWEGTPHFEATESLVHPPNSRSEIPRHHDPECLSCHVTGWNPQNYYPYTSGYLSLDKSDHLLGSGCENCHGPGAEHSAAEREGSGVGEERLANLRDRMRLPLSRAKERCMECHDLDNSPDFHKPDAFEDIYWPEVEHYGLD